MESGKATLLPNSSQDKIKAMAENGSLGKMTVAELKSVIQQREPELTVNGKKKD